MSGPPPRTPLKSECFDVAWRVLYPLASAKDDAGAARKGVRAMDLWYELVIRETGDFNEEILKKAEKTLLVPPDDTDEEDD